MRVQKELSATIREAMREKNVNENDLAKVLGISPIMVGKLLCGDVVPSRHLQKQMVEVLGIEPDTVSQLSSSNERKAHRAMSRDEEMKKAA